MNSFIKSLLVLAVAMVSIQVGASLAKQLFPVMGAPGTTAYRVGFAALLMALLFKPWKSTFNRKHLSTLFAYGASLGLMNYFFYLALQRIPLGIAVALEFTGPLGVALFSSKKLVDLIWALLAGVGIVLILPLAPSDTKLDSIGIVFALVAGILWGLYIIFGKKAGETLKGPTASSLGMIVAALFVTPLGVIQNGSAMLTPSLIPLALAIAVFSSAVPYTLEMYALKNLPSQTFGILMSVEPVIAALAGLIILNEKLTITQWLAILCVVTASAGTSLTAYRKRIKNN